MNDEPLAPIPECRRPGWRGTTARGMARLLIYPFEAVIGLYLIVSGAATLFGYGINDPVATLLPGWLATALTCITIISGTLILTGTASALHRIEVAGLIFLIGVVTCRFILYEVYLGFGSQFVTTGIFDAAIIWASAARLNTVRKGHAIVRIVAADGKPR